MNTIPVDPRILGALATFATAGIAVVIFAAQDHARFAYRAWRYRRDHSLDALLDPSWDASGAKPDTIALVRRVQQLARDERAGAPAVRFQVMLAQAALDDVSHRLGHPLANTAGDMAAIAVERVALEARTAAEASA